MSEMPNMTSEQVCASSVYVVCMWCAYVMHDQGMTKHTWVKVCKTHNQRSKHDKHA